MCMCVCTVRVYVCMNVCVCVLVKVSVCGCDTFRNKCDVSHPVFVLSKKADQKRAHRLVSVNMLNAYINILAN